MTGCCYTHRVGGGTHIQTNNSSIDIIIKNIEGPRQARKVDLEIIVDDVSEMLHISNEKPTHELNDNIKLQLVEKQDKKLGSKRIKISYWWEGKYLVYNRNYI